MAQIEILEKRESDQEWIKETIQREWHSDRVVIKVKEIYPVEFDALIALRDSKRLGLPTYRFVDTECEILALNTILKRQRVGSNLMSYLEDKVLRKGCKALSVTTTNDNLDALAFYQQLGFNIVSIQLNAMEYARKKKPSIPKIGLHDMPIQDEIVLKKELQKGNH